MRPDQLYGLRYGTVPVVRRVGGLANTVSDASPEALLADEATGFVFESAIVAALANALREAVRLYAQPKQWRQIMLHGMAWHGMAQNYSW